MASEKYKAAYKRLPHPATGECRVKDTGRRHLDFNSVPLNLQEGTYVMGEVKSRCLINKWSPSNKVDFSSYSIMKNIRHQSIVTIENHYDENGKSRLVLSWVDGSLSAWVKHSGKRRCFETATEVRGSCPSKLLRRVIIDTCRGMEHLFKENIYPEEIKVSDLFLCKEGGQNFSAKLLICQADCLTGDQAKEQRKNKLWKDIQNVFEEMCKEADISLSCPAANFIGYIEKGEVDKLEGFPDVWSWEKKACYLLTLMAADKSKVCKALKKLKIGWPRGTNNAIREVLKRVIDEEKKRVNPVQYVVGDPYDYLRLCRNIVKHWKSISQSVPYLKQSCSSVQHFLRLMESWNPNIWCDLYQEIGWPHVN